MAKKRIFFSVKQRISFYTWTKIIFLPKKRSFFLAEMTILVKKATSWQKFVLAGKRSFFLAKRRIFFLVTKELLFLAKKNILFLAKKSIFFAMKKIFFLVVGPGSSVLGPLS